MLKFLKEKLFISSPYRSEFRVMNREFNNMAGIFVGFLYLLCTGIGLAAAIFAQAAELSTIVPIYITGFGITIVIIALLITMRKRKMTTHWLSEALSITQIVLCLVLFQLSSHNEVSQIGLKNIDVIIILMFSTIFLMRFELYIMLTIQIINTIVTIVLTVMVKDLICNYGASITNMVVTGIVSTICVYIYWRIRLENHRNAKELHKMATSDALTKLFNRRGFDSYIDLAWEESYRSSADLAMIIIDIDFFKNYNDFYGHLKGDECLSQIADILSDSVRKDDFVARYGGEEFAVIMRNTSPEAAQHVADRILSNVRGKNIPHADSLVAMNVTVSLGCMACQPSSDRISQHEFISCADEALYMAKNHGRNQVVFHPRSKNRFVRE